MQPRPPRPITLPTTRRVEDAIDFPTTSTDNGRERARAQPESVRVTMPADPPTLTPRLARALTRIIAKAASDTLAAGTNRPVSRRPRADARQPYALRGLLFCGLCGRRMQGNTTHGTLRYRCRYPAEYALTEGHEHPKQVYVAERPIVGELDRWIASLFDPEHLDRTCEQLAAASATPDNGDVAGMELARRKVADCDRRLGRYQGALDSGADSAVVATWISQVQGEKLAAQKALAVTPPQSSTPAEIRDLITRLGDVVATLGRAEGEAKTELYAALGLRLTYRPNERQVDVVATPRAVDVSACRRGDLNPHPLARTRPSTYSGSPFR